MSLRNSLEPFPDLPVDICRRIFEALALDYNGRSSCLTLVLVSKTVREWINPILYQVIDLSTRSTSSTRLNGLIKSLRHGPNPLSRFVRTLWIAHGNDLVPEIIALCPSLKRLLLWVPETDFEALLSAIRSTGVTHLAVNQFRQLHLMPQSITHVCFILLPDQDGRMHDAAGWASLFASQPAITHIMFCWGVTGKLDEGLFNPTGICSLVSIVASVAPKTLKTIVGHPDIVWDPLDDDTLAALQRMHEEITDERFVLVCPDPAFKHIDGIACYETYHDWRKEWVDWGHSLPEGEQDVFEMADRYLSIQAERKSKT